MVAVLGFAIGRTRNDSGWLIVWFLLFIFLGIPFVLLCLRDLLMSLFARRDESFRAWLILHICAAFAAAIGYGLGHLAAVSGHPKAALHQWLVLLLPALVYVAPLFLAVNSGNLRFLEALAGAFRRGRREE
jgi:hypothetical protein